MTRVFDFDRALVRAPAATVVDGLRTGPEAPRFDRIVAEHQAYVAALEGAGVVVDRLPPLPGHPDSVFVEDPAFVVAEGAILLRPGAPSRFAEAAALAPALRGHFSAVAEVDQGFVDGGDILVLPDEILVGLSARTDESGARRFGELARDLGRRTRIVEPPPGLLHLKTGCALLDEATMIAVPAVAPLFPGYEVLATPEGEEHSANLIRVNDRLLMGAGFPKTAAMLAARGLDVVQTPASEIAKIDAGLSCMSLRWLSGPARSTDAAVREALLAFARCREEDDVELEDLLERLIDEHGWPPVAEGILRVLESDEPELWPSATMAIWTFCGRRTIDSDRAIALVYHRLGPAPSDHDENLSWSIASKLKGVGYLSDYDPLADPAVAAHLAKLRR